MNGYLILQHADRLQRQLELTRQVIAEKEKAERERQKKQKAAELKRLQKWFESMGTSELESHIRGKKDHAKLAKRILTRRLEAARHRSKCKTQLQLDATTNIPCDPDDADRDQWRIHGA